LNDELPDRTLSFMGSAEALDRFERLTAWPMFVLALLSIPLLLAPVVLDLPSEVEDTIFALDVFIWAAFMLENGIRLFLAPRKWAYVEWTWEELR
jgi:hypothetical protein